MLNSCENSAKILKIACIHLGTVANEDTTKNALLDQKTDVFFQTGLILKSHDKCKSTLKIKKMHNGMNWHFLFNLNW